MDRGIEGLRVREGGLGLQGWKVRFRGLGIGLEG